MGFELALVGYVLLGLFAGLLAGLFGVGGGATMVPVLAMLFAAQAFPAEHLLHVALATSMATIIFTASSSLRAHHAHGAVDWRIVRLMTPGIAIGTFVGSLIAASVSSRALAIFFVVFILLVAAQMAANLRPAASRGLPGAAGIFGVSSLIGVVSTLVAIGGGSMTVPWLAWCNLPIQRAIGTSAAVGLPIAVFGTLGYLWHGQEVAGLPGDSFGYLYWPALACLIPASMLAAPVGARLAHRLPVATLKRAFALLLVVLAAKMLWSVWGS